LLLQQSHALGPGGVPHRGLHPLHAMLRTT
jgi:hypothetical protein